MENASPEEAVDEQIGWAREWEKAGIDSFNGLRIVFFLLLVFMLAGVLNHHWYFFAMLVPEIYLFLVLRDIFRGVRAHQNTLQLLFWARARIARLRAAGKEIEGVRWEPELKNWPGWYPGR